MSEAFEQAKTQVENIKRLVAALNVDYDRLRELWEQDWAEVDREELEELEAAAGDCESEVDALEAIHEGALSVEVRSGWREAGSSWKAAQPEEFRIVLCTGGPHVELRGTLDYNGEPNSVCVLYSDGWTENGEFPLSSEEREVVLTYCEQFYFG